MSVDNLAKLLHAAVVFVALLFYCKARFTRSRKNEKGKQESRP